MQDTQIALFGGVPDEIAQALAAAGRSVKQAATLVELEAITPLDVVVIGPRWASDRHLLDESPAAVDAAVRLNYEQSVYASQTAARHMIERGDGGRIIFLGHVAALMPFARQGMLGMSLAMLIPLVKMAAVDLGPHDITVNMVATGPRDEAHTDHITAGTPIERITTPQDVGAALAFLASSAASAITGTLIRVDGGYTLTRSDGRSPFEE